MRVKGHKLYMEHNGEVVKEESAWTGICPCGWTENCRLKLDVMSEYRHHLEHVNELSDKGHNIYTDADKLYYAEKIKSIKGD